ncbi:hypothetical protein [Acetobacter fabarum]|uniref:hypothetical protein n=1 Tax=Acetobacter fabarum TaxID=483199 RepID=UPI0033A8CB69
MLQFTRRMSLLALCTGLALPTLNTPAQARHRHADTNLPASVSATCDNQDFLSKQQAFENGGPKANAAVHICGTVLTLSKTARQTRSGRHGYFYITVAPNISIRIVTNLDEMHTPAWPWVAKGDKVEVVGRYYYDSARQQGVDWTHRGTGRSWSIPGYVIVNGTKYD